MDHFPPSSSTMASFVSFSPHELNSSLSPMVEGVNSSVRTRKMKVRNQQNIQDGDNLLRGLSESETIREE